MPFILQALSLPLTEMDPDLRDQMLKVRVMDAQALEGNVGLLNIFKTGTKLAMCVRHDSDKIIHWQGGRIAGGFAVNHKSQRG